MKGKERPSLVGVVRMLPTLTVGDILGGPQRGKASQGGPKLSQAVRGLPTLTASMVTLADMDQAAYHSSNRPPYYSGGGQLNPHWCEWFMGWPLGWTALEPSGTDRFREWRQQHSPSLQNS